MAMHEKLACSFSAWYENFRAVTIESRIIDISEDVLQYLMSDGSLVLPNENIGILSNSEQNHSQNICETNNDSDRDWDNAAVSLPQPEFPEFSAIIHRCITELGGSVLPKLNWSTPKDAAWISFNRTLQCSTLNEILLLLKSSEFIAHDLMQPFDGLATKDLIESGAECCECDQNSDCQQASCSNLESIQEKSDDNKVNYTQCSNATTQNSDSPELNRIDSDVSTSNSGNKMHNAKIKITSFKYQLILRKWQSIPEAEEFRCFVFNRKLIAISQRNDSIFFPEISAAKKDIYRAISHFFVKKIVNKFPLSSYTFDVWCQNLSRVILVDFNPFCKTTDSLLFTWAQINELSTNQNASEAEFRCVETAIGGGGISNCPMRRYAMPVDLLDLTTGSDINKFIDLMKINDGGIQTGLSSDDDEN